MIAPKFDPDLATRSVVRVGDGRGFIIAAPDDRVILTAAHCLPRFPPAASISHTEERTYEGLLGLLGTDAPKVWAECLFADPVADLVVLGAPDDQMLYNEAVAYEHLADGAPALRIVNPPTNGRAWLLNLKRRWFPCNVTASSRALWISDAAEPIEGGMSGSPILDADGAAIGVLVCSDVSKDATEGGPNPVLAADLPGWLLNRIDLYPGAA